MTGDSKKTPAEDRRYQRAARLLASKLGVDWRDLPAEQVLDYARKLDIAAEKDNSEPRPPASRGRHCKRP